MRLSTYTTYIAAIHRDLERQSLGLTNGGVALSALVNITACSMAKVIKDHGLASGDYPENWRARNVLRAIA